MTTTQQQPAAEGEWVLVPRALTAENGAKDALRSEFCEYFTFICLECTDGLIDGEPCDDCDGKGEHRAEVPVSWDTIKKIHAAIVAHFAAAPAKVAVGDAWLPPTEESIQALEAWGLTREAAEQKAARACRCCGRLGHPEAALREKEHG